MQFCRQQIIDVGVLACFGSSNSVKTELVINYLQFGDAQHGIIDVFIIIIIISIIGIIIQ